LWIGAQVNELLFSRNVGVVLLDNKSTHVISSANVIVCGHTLVFGKIPVGEYDIAFYDVRADSHYDINIIFESGQEIQGEIGYVTHGLDFFDAIKVTNTGVVHKKRTTFKAQ
jgi:hypothetical protein